MFGNFRPGNALKASVTMEAKTSMDCSWNFSCKPTVQLRPQHEQSSMTRTLFDCRMPKRFPINFKSGDSPSLSNQTNLFAPPPRFPPKLQLQCQALAWHSCSCRWWHSRLWRGSLRSPLTWLASWREAWKHGTEASNRWAWNHLQCHRWATCQDSPNHWALPFTEPANQSQNMRWHGSTQFFFLTSQFFCPTQVFLEKGHTFRSKWCRFFHKVFFYHRLNLRVHKLIKASGMPCSYDSFNKSIWVTGDSHTDLFYCCIGCNL